MGGNCNFCRQKCNGESLGVGLMQGGSSLEENSGQEARRFVCRKNTRNFGKTSFQGQIQRGGGNLQKETSPPPPEGQGLPRRKCSHSQFYWGQGRQATKGPISGFTLFFARVFSPHQGCCLCCTVQHNPGVICAGDTKAGNPVKRAAFVRES